MNLLTFFKNTFNLSEITSEAQSKSNRNISPKPSNSTTFESNSKLQEDLSHLQSKLNSLEQKFSNFGGISPNTLLKESKYLVSNENPINKQNPSFFFNVKFY